MVKTILLLVLAFWNAELAVGQSTAELHKEVAALKQKVAALEQRLDLVISLLNKQGEKSSAKLAEHAADTPAAAALRPAPPSASPAPVASRIQCQATTKKGSQCSRLAAAGASYCWQHAG